MGTLPISLALSVVTADTLVDVEGDLLSKTGSVKLGAKGIVNLTTTAAEKSFASTNMTANPNGSISIIPGANGSNGSLSSGNTGTTGGSKSGGFFAVAVALQDVAVKVRENADITAAKDVVILSESEERVNTRATSGDGSTASETKSVGSVVDIITLLINSAQTKLTNHFQMGNKLDGAKQQVEGTDGYEVRSTATDKGTVVVPAKVKAGETVTVRVTPKEGFRLTGLTYTYILPGESVPRTSNIVVRDGVTNYEFVMPNGHTNVIPIFEANPSGPGTGVDEWGLGDLFDENQTDNSQGINGLFNTGTHGSSAQTTTQTGTGTEYTITVGNLTNGALIPAADRAASGGQVVITVNPADGYRLKENTLKATAKFGTGTEERTTIQTLVKNTAGQYILNMPAGNVTLTAEFEANPTGSAGTTPSTAANTAPKTNNSQSQVVGALAVAVVTNKNEAVVDTTGTIHAGGKVSINANGVTQSVSVADGSPIATPAGSDTTTGGSSGSETGSETGSQGQNGVGDTIHQPKPGTVTITTTPPATQTNPNPTPETNTISVQTAATVNGEIEIRGTTALAFGVNADRGYQYHSGSLIFSLVTKDGKNVTGSLVEKAGGNYMLPETVVQDGTNTTITLDNAFLMTVVSCAVTAVFDEMPHIITKAGTTADFTVKEKAHDGEKVIVTINQDAHGKKVESITVKDENNQTINITSENGVYSFEMPNKPVTITVNLVDKSFAVSFVDENGAAIGADYIKASDTNADAGEKVILTLLEKAVAEGKEVTEIKAQLYKSENGTQTAVGTAVVVNNMEFTVPQLPTGAGQSDTYVLRITVKFAQKAFDVTVGTMTNGTVKGPVKADAGETITVTVTPNEGFRLRENSLSASATSGTTVQQVTAVNTQGVYTIRIPDLPTGQTAMSIVLNAIFEKDPNYTGKTTQKKSTLGIGVGINVSVTEHTNNAFIKNGTIIANGLELSAVSGSPSDKVLSSATSKAGYSQGDIGLGGAITVHVASAKTKAVVGKNVVLKLMDLSDLMLDAQSYDRFVTVAESSPTVRTVAPGSGVIIGQTGQSAAKVGVGAGLAIGVYGVDVVAAIEDGTKIELIDKFGNPSESAQLSDINISALHSSTEAMSAKAGSSGGTSVSPVLSLTVSGGNTSAYLGKGDGLKVKDDVNVSSMSDIARQIAANASAAGSGAGIGGSFVISVLNDSSRASVRRSIKANNIKVTNSSKNTVKAVSRASAAGASSRQPAVTGLPGSSGTTVTGDGSVPAGSESDQQANQNILGAASLANGVGTTNVNGGIVNNMNTGRQTAQTSEGSIKVAAGFALNIMSHVAESYLDEDIMIEAAKAVTVYSEALTSADVLANAAATQSEIGVGVAVAINIADYENTAKVLSGVKAENLYVQAVMIENPEGGEEEEAPPTSIVDAAVRKAVRQALDEALEASDLESTLGKEIIAKMITDIVAEMTAGTIETLLRGTGLEGMISTDIEHKVETFLATFDTKAADVIRNWMMQFILTEVQNLIINGTASGSQAQKPVSPVFPAEQAQKAKITPEQKLRIETAAIGMANELFGEFINVAQLKAFLKGNIVQTLKTKALAAAKNAMVAIPTAAFDALSSYLDLGIEEEDNTAKNTFVTQSVSGAGASSVGVAGSVAIAVIDGNTKAFIAAADETQYPVIVTGDVVIAALSRQKEKAVATSAVDADGDPDINTTAGSNSDIGDGNSAGTLHPSVMTNDINVAASRNGTVSASGQQQAGQTITITVTPDQGYRLAATNGVKVFRTDTSAEIPITTDANGNISFVIPTDYVAGSGIKFNIVSTFERITHTIGTTTVSMTNTAPGATGTTAAPAGAATVSVKSASDTATTGNSGSAGEGEKVFVTVTPATGYAIEKIVYKYNAAVPGQPQSPPTPTEQQITTVEDAMQNKYSFLMPSYDITGIEVILKRITTLPGSGGSGTTTAKPKTSSGMSVGVGASFAFNLVDMNVEAYTERDLIAGTLDIRADGVHNVETHAVAGSDPLAQKGGSSLIPPVGSGGTGSGTTGGTTGGTTTPAPDDDGAASMEVALDAAVALGIITNNFRAYVPAGVVIITTGDLDISANQTGKTTTKGSAFTVGQSTAVGATVAINLVESEITAEFLGEGTASGKARISATAFNKDDCISVATAMGADLQRYLSIFGNVTGTIEQTLNSITTGSFLPSDIRTTNNNNATATTINDQMAMNGLNGMALSQNATRGTQTPTNPGGEGNSLQVAAAVSTNITENNAIARMAGKLQAEALDVLSDNKANFRTLATGAAMSLASGSNSIAAAVAVLVNKNKSHAVIAEKAMIDTDENLNIKAFQTQNMDDEYRGWLGAQALAGSVSGQGKASVAGAFAIIRSSADTLAEVGRKADVEAGDMIILATDKSKLAVRAGGVSISTGATVGIGASLGLIYADNTVRAIINEKAEINAGSLDLAAKKLKVDFSDFETALGWDYLLTDSTGTTATAAEKGIVDINKGTNGYKVTINASTDKLIELIDLMNFLSSTNYYAEAIAGGIASGTGTVTGAGSLAMVFFNNVTEAIIADDVIIILAGDADKANMDVTAYGDTTARLISGALSASGSKVGVGVTVGTLENEDQVRTKIGNRVTISLPGTYSQTAETRFDALVVTAAATVATTGVGVGGAINTILMDNTTESIAGEGEKSTITAGQGVNIEALAEEDLIHVAANASVSGGKVAAGGTVAVITNDSVTSVKIGDYVVITSENGGITVHAYLDERMITALASLSASTGAAGAAGAINTFVTNSVTGAEVGNYAQLTAKDHIEVMAEGDTWMLVINAALSAASQAAIGATVTVNTYNRSVDAIVGEYAKLVSTNGNILIQALADDMTLSVALAAGAASTMAMTGTIPTIVGESKVTAEVKQYAQLTAGDSIGVIGNLNSDQYFIAGGLAAAGTAAVGATVSTVVQANTVKALVGNHAKLTANGIGTGISVPNRADKRRGITVYANAKENIIMASVAAGAAGTAAVNGVVNTLVIENTVMASVGENAGLTAVVPSEDEEGENDEEGPSADIIIEANDETDIIDLAGALSAAGTVGVGATVVTLVFGKNVEASVGSGSVLNADGSVLVTANTVDDLYLLALGFGASGTVGVAGNVNVLVFQNHAKAILGGMVTAGKDVNVNANTDSFLVNAALSAAASGTVAGTAVAVVTYFYNETIAYVRANANIKADGNIRITAASEELVTSDGAGLAASGTVAVGGTADVVITKVVTKAYTEDHVTLKGNSIHIEAIDDYDLIAVAATIAGSGTVGAGVTVLTSVAYNTVVAQIGANNTVTANTDLIVKAESDRNVQIYTGSVGAGGVAGLAGTVAVVVIGSKLNDEAHDGIYVSGQDDEGNKMSSIDPQKQTDEAFSKADSRAKDYKPKESLNDLLASDGSSAEDSTVNGSEYGQDTSSRTNTNDTKMNDELYDRTANIGQDAATGATINGVELKDATQALVGSDTVIITGNDVKITAYDNLTADVIAGTLAAGASGGAAGAGVAVVITNSNVQAIVDSNVTISAGNNVIVKAQIGAKEREIKAQTSEWIVDEDEKGNPKQMSSEEINKKLVEDGISDEEDTTSTIRVIGVTAGVGLYAGIAVTVAVLNASSTARAIMAGNIQKGTLDGKELIVQSVLVETSMNYGQVLTTTVGVGGGLVGISGSVAVTMYNGDAEASIAGTATVNDVAGTITVNSNGTVNAISVATGLAAGAGAVNAGAATVINRTRIDTYVGQGVVINSPAAVLNVGSDYTAEGKAYVISVAGGAVAVGASVAIVISALEQLSYIGKTPYGETIITGSVGTNGQITVNTVNVTNDATSITTVNGYGIAGGAAAVNGIVAIGMNRTVGYAAISQANVTADEINVTATMDGDVQVVTTAITGGAVAVGATVALSELKTDNHALIDMTGAKVEGGNITVSAGTENNPYDSQALTSVITGSAGTFAAAVNYAKAYNKAGNIAEIIGGAGDVIADTLKVYAHGKTRAYAVIANAGIGGITVNVSVAQAEIASVQKAQIDAAGSITAQNAIEATSIQNNQTDNFGVFDLLFGKIEDKGGQEEQTLGITFSAMAEARIFSAAAGMAVANANAATATANAASIARVSAGKINTNNKNIHVYNKGYSRAYAKADNLSFGAASVSVNVVTADAAGIFEASAGSTGDDEEGVTAADITVINEYEAYAEAETVQGLGEVSAALVDIASNTALAKVTTDAKAYIDGNGKITANNITVLVKGTVVADAYINPAKISASYANIAANVVLATLNAVQEAYVNGAAITANTLTVRSLYNVNEEEIGYDGSTGKPFVPNVNGEKGAFAKVGASVAEISGASGKVSTAQAVSDSTVKAYVSGAVTNISGALIVDVFATSYAKALVEKPVASVNLASAGVVMIQSDAKGTYTAYIDTEGSTEGNGIYADSIKVAVGYQTKADAITGPGGGKGGVGISGVSINVNRADANAATIAEAYVKGDGILTVSEENLEVYARGKAVANADIDKANVTISLVDIAANETNATVRVLQSAYMNFAGTAVIEKGKIIIASDYTVTGNGAFATIGTVTPGSGVQVSLISGSVAMATAISRVTNKAYIKGSGTVTAERDVTVQAKTDSLAEAVANKASTYALAELCGLYAKSDTSDITESFIQGLDVISYGKVTVYAEGKTTSKATSASGNGLSLISGSSGVMNANIGKGENAQTVRAYIGDDANVTATGDIEVKAYNEGYAIARMTEGHKVSVISGASNKVPTNSNYLTESYIGKNAVVKSLRGSVKVTASDLARADSLVDGNSVGILVSASSKYAENIVNQVVKAEVREGATAEAYRDLQILAESNAQMNAYTHANSGGIFDKGTLKAFNTLTRTVDVLIKKDAYLFADFGTLTVKASAGQADSIVTKGDGSGAGLATFGEVEVTASVTSDATVTVETGASMKNIFGKIDIQALSGCSNVNTRGEFSGSGAVTEPRSRAYVTALNLDAKVDIGKENGNPGEIRGKNIYIGAGTGNLYVKSYTYAKTSGLGGSAVARSTVNLTQTKEISINNVLLKAYDALNVKADATPTNDAQHIDIYAGTQINAFAGWIES